ncbi:MAG: hypothetical protein ACXVAY_15710 [Mucilaginibacter sp.]
MQNIEIRPLEGIVIENIGNVLLGQHESLLYALLGVPSKTYERNRIFYDGLEVRIDLNQFQRIEFIEFIYGPYPDKTELSIYGINPFAIGAEKLLEILSFHNQGEIDISEAPYSYGFLNTSVGVWREFTTEDIGSMTNEITPSGMVERNHDNFAEDLKKAQNFWTIGIGVEGYYKA